MRDLRRPVQTRDAILSVVKLLSPQLNPIGNNSVITIFLLTRRAD